MLRASTTAAAAAECPFVPTVPQTNGAKEKKLLLLLQLLTACPPQPDPQHAAAQSQLPDPAQEKQQVLRSI
jgi:hypothetical protein